MNVLDSTRVMVDLSVIDGIYVTEDPRAGGIGAMVIWCGYCCKRLHYDWRHMGYAPFLTLLVKMADVHREAECPNPAGPFVSDWNPLMVRVWEEEAGE